MKPILSSRKLALAAAAAAVGITMLPYSAHAAWRGLRTFQCVISTGNWHFDGLYGGFTTRSVRAFQATHHIKVDGVAGPDTYKALGLKYRRTLKCGTGGNDVFLLQQTLAAAGFWYGGIADHPPKATPVPTETPTVMPTDIPSAMSTPVTPESPIVSTPEGTPSPQPTELPTPMATATPMPEPSIAENRPTFEVQGGDWMVPMNAGSLNYDYSLTRPLWLGSASLWLGDFGIGGAVNVFNTTYTNYQQNVYFQQNTLMYDALLRYRMDHGYYQVFAGYRGLGIGDVNFATLGVGLDRPLIGDWLWLQAQAQAGHNFQSDYFLDGQAGLGLRISLLELELGFRHLAFQNNNDPLFNINGPTANVKLMF